jgi:TonB family protein
MRTSSVTVRRGLACAVLWLLAGTTPAAMRETALAASAQVLMKEEKFAEAAAILEPLAVRNDPDALLLQGLLEATGAGVAMDSSAAHHRWAQAAHLGQRDAIRLLIPTLHDAFQRAWWTEQLAAAPEPTVKLLVNLVQMERGGVRANGEAALSWNTRLAAQGEPMGWFNLYAMRRNNYIWMMQRKEELLALLRKAALAGYPPALTELAGLYAEDPAGIKMPNRLLEPDARQAAIYLQRAADLGDRRAQLLWAHQLKRGRGGVEKNPELAVEYYLRSSENGDAHAAYFLYEAYNGGEGASRDEVLASEYLKLAAERDNDLAASMLGARLYRGQGMPVDEVRGAAMLMRAVVTDVVPNDDAIALVAYALCYGRGLPKDEAVALKWAEWAARKGSVAAKFQLGCQYREGLGVAKDEAAGYAHLLEAAKSGHDVALYQVAACQIQGFCTAKDVPAGAKRLEELRAGKGRYAAVASYLLAQLKLGAHGSPEYDRAAAMDLLTEAVNGGHNEARFIQAMLAAEDMEESEAIEKLSRAINESVAEGHASAKTLLERYQGDAVKAARSFVRRAPPPPGEEEIARRISALGVTPLNSRPRPVHQGPPQYPYLLSAAGLEGNAVVEFIINRDGRVVEARVVSATNTAFGATAQRAVEEWRFAPGMSEGRKVATRVKQLIEFNLDSPAK